MWGHKILDGLTEEEGVPKRPGWILAFLVLLAMALRLLLFHRHQIIEGDGVHYAALARLISREGNFSGAANEYWSNLWPLAIAAFDVFVRDIELAGRLASALFGSLTVIPVFFVAREFLNTRTSLAAASLVVAQPYILRFSVLLYTEAFYTFLLTWVLWLGIRLIRSPARWERWLLFGLSIGLGLWTRPEIQAPAFLLTAAALVCIGLKRLSIHKALKGGLIFAGVILISLFSRALLIQHYQGTWQFGFGEKAVINIRMGVLAYDHAEAEKFLNAFENGQFVNLWQQRSSLLPFLWENRARVLGRMKLNLPRIYQSCVAVLAPTRGVRWHRRAAWSLAFLGLLGMLISGKTRRWALLLILIFLAYSLPWLLVFVLDRFVVPLAVISILFTAAGLLVLESGISSLFKRRRLAAWPVVSFVIVLSFIMRTSTWARHDRHFIWENDPVVQKEAGLFLKENFPQETRILTWGPHIPYYFYDGNPYDPCIQNIPYAPYEAVMEYVHREKIALLALPEWLLIGSDFPIKGLAAEGAQAEGLEFVKMIGRDQPERVWIYKVLPKP
ncbi:MAG: glycosyltransferase family 39 protein [Candidatus Aminicenantes bacterium]|nr:glycosyltransferase family 39 protein [Candidatus Aminicenantes bacterium]